MMESNVVWDELEMDMVSLDFRQLFPEFTFDGKEAFAHVIRGELWEAIKVLGNGITDAIGYQKEELRILFLTIVILGIVGALFSNFADLFKDHQVSDLAFYFVYLLLIAVLLKFFADAAGTVREILHGVTTFIRLYIPTYMIVVGSASGITSASAYYHLLLIVVYLIEWGYLSVLLPLVYGYVLLTVINGIWMEEKLGLLLELIEKAIGGSIKVTLGIITGFSLLQAMISPVIDSLQSTALKKAVYALPGVGGLTEGMFEMVIGSAVLVKNSIGIYITLVLILLCAVPILKLTLLSCVVKLSAAFIGIVSDKRMTGCANRVGDGNLMLLKIVLASVGMFIIQIAIITYTTGRNMM